VGQSAYVKHPNDHYYSFNDTSNDLVLRLLKLPLGYHSLILYPNIETIRKFMLNT